MCFSWMTTQRKHEPFLQQQKHSFHAVIFFSNNGRIGQAEGSRFESERRALFDKFFLGFIRRLWKCSSSLGFELGCSSSSPRRRRAHSADPADAGAVRGANGARLLAVRLRGRGCDFVKSQRKAAPRDISLFPLFLSAEPQSRSRTLPRGRQAPCRHAARPLTAPRGLDHSASPEGPSPSPSGGKITCFN